MGLCITWGTKEDRGVLEGYVEGYAWYNISTANGHDCHVHRSTLQNHMTAEQIAKAQELSKEMLKKNPKLLK